MLDDTPAIGQGTGYGLSGEGNSSKQAGHPAPNWLQLRAGVQEPGF